MTPASDLLAAYDAQLRGEAEVHRAASWEHVGPLWRSVSARGGFVSYESLEGYDLPALVAATVAWFAEETDVDTFEWKTRGHDPLPDLDTVLTGAGLVPEEVETVMVGSAVALAVEVDLPAGVEVLRIDDDPALLAESAALQRAVFGRGGPDDAVLVREGAGLVQKWAALADGTVVSTGRVDAVPGTEFAGLWGGVTDPAWRGRGVYRAVTAARARSALEHGVRWLHSDCTVMSRPILERSGLVAVTTTTPYMWQRNAT